MSEIDRAIEAYRAELTSEAELAHADLDEIEDHLRALCDELRATGMPAAEAIAEAGRRLGEPKALAREHARVRSPFGATLSWSRAWGAAALMTASLACDALAVSRHHGWSLRLVLSPFGIQFVAGIVVALALAMRLTWARPIALGRAACFMIPMGLWLIESSGWSPLYLACDAGIVVLLAPRGRGELTAAGAALALQIWACCAADYSFGFRLFSAASSIAFLTAVVATTGGILRARWGAIASAVSALSLAVATYQVWPLRYQSPNTDLFQLGIDALLVTGACAAAVATLLAWRGARSNPGTLRSILD